MYNFKLYESNTSGNRYIGARIVDRQLIFSKQFINLLNSEYVSIEYDTDNKALLLTEIMSSNCKKSHYKIKNKSININIVKFMEKGRYLYKEKKYNGFLLLKT